MLEKAPILISNRQAYLMMRYLRHSGTVRIKAKGNRKYARTWLITPKHADEAPKPHFPFKRSKHWR